MKKIKKALYLFFSVILFFVFIVHISSCDSKKYKQKLDYTETVLKYYIKNDLYYDQETNDVRFFDQFRFDDIKFNLQEDGTFIFNCFEEIVTGTWGIKFISFQESKYIYKFNNGEELKKLSTGVLYKDIQFSYYNLRKDYHILQFQQVLSQSTNENYSLEKMLSKQADILEDCIQRKNVISINDQTYYTGVIQFNKNPSIRSVSKRQYRYQTAMLYNEDGEKYIVINDSNERYYIKSERLNIDNDTNYYNYLENKITICDNYFKTGRCILAKAITKDGKYDCDPENLISTIDSAIYFY